MGQRALLIAAFAVLLTGIAYAELAVDSNAPAMPPCVSQALDLSIANSTHVYQAGPGLSPGWYEIWCRKAAGKAAGQMDAWNAYGPVQIVGGVFYVFDLSSRDLYIRNPRKIDFTLNDPEPGRAEIWFKLDGKSSYEICLEGPYESEGRAKHRAPNSSIEEAILFQLASDASVNDGPHSPTNFSLERECIITKIQTLHWNHGKGKIPGTIGLKDYRGKTYGPWQASGMPGVGGVPKRQLDSGD